MRPRIIEAVLQFYAHQNNYVYGVVVALVW